MDSGSYENLSVDLRDGRATVVLESTSRQNALNETLVEELRTLLDRADREEGLRCLVLRGQPEAFCAGADLSGFDQDATDGEKIDRLAGDLHEALIAIRELPVPVVTGVQGAAAGAGFGLALCGDYVLAHSEARFEYAYGRLGLTGDCGVTYILPRLVGLKTAKQIVLMNQGFTAGEAREMGLVTEVAEPGSFEDRLEEVAAQLTAGPTQALARDKELLNRSLDRSLEEQLQREKKTMVECTRTEDYQRGIQAFFNKEAPEFTGE